MRYILVLVSVMLFSFTTSSEIDYRKVFGRVDYEWAVNWLKQNDKIISIYSDKYNIPARELRSHYFS